MAQVELYATKFCPFCISAKQLLKRKAVAYSEIDVTGDPQERAAMRARANGDNKVPQIFIDGTHIGGCDELHALERAGKLDRLLAG